MLSVSEALQVPHELPTLLALACVSAAVAGKVVVEPRPAWTEPVSIYTGTILPPGSRKSPTFAKMLGPLKEWEKETIRAASESHLKAQDKVDVARQRLETLKRKAVRGKASAEDLERAREGLLKAEEAVPPDGRLLAGDITPEALVDRLARQGERLAVLEPEPGPLQMIAGRYSEHARLNELNKAWGGEPFTVDRIGREPTVVANPALTLAVLLQPDVLESLPNSRSLRSEGLVARILWCVPPDGLGSRLTGPEVPALDSEAFQRYRSTLLKLLDFNPPPDASGERRALLLDQEATEVLHRFEAEVEREMADGGRYAAIRDWAGKAVGQSLRMAALLELAARASDGRPMTDSIGSWAMAGGVRLIRALATHAQFVLGGLEPDPRTEALLYLLSRLRELPPGTTLSQLGDSARHTRHINDMGDVEDLVAELEARGCVRRRHQKGKRGPGRRPSPVLELHPQLR